MKKEEKVMLTVNINNSVILIPESSYSSNYLYITFSHASIKVNDSFDTTKIILNLNENEELLTIDKKFTFNVNSFKDDDLLPFTKIDIGAKDLNIYFYIDRTVDSMGVVENFDLTIKAPKKEDVTFHFRLDEWKKKKYQSKSVIYVNPSIKFLITNANIETSIVIN